MLIYNYDARTKEYLGCCEAEADPAETKKQGHFVPLIPANATLKTVINPVQGKARVFTNSNWNYVDDYRGNFKINEEMVFIEIVDLYEDLTGYDIKTLDEKEVIEKVGLDKYVFDNGHLRHKTAKEMEEEEQERVANLTMTALDFIGFLEDSGLDYGTEIVPYLNAHTDLDKQLKYCQNVYCGVVQALCPLEVDGKVITKDMVIYAFKHKNGEV